MAAKWENWPKNGSNMAIFPFLGDFSPFFAVGSKSIFRPFFSHFGPEGLCRAIGIANLGPTSQAGSSHQLGYVQLHHEVNEKELILQNVSMLQQFPRVTSIGSLPPNPRKIPRNPEEPRGAPESPRRDPAEPSERPPQSPLRGRFPRRASRRVVPLGW